MDTTAGAKASRAETEERNDVGVGDGGDELERLKRDAFGAAFVARIRETDPSVHAEYNPADFTITIEGRGILKLTSTYRTYLATLAIPTSDVLGDAARFVLQTLDDTADDTLAHFSEAKARILPVIRSRQTFKGNQDRAILFRVIGDDLAVALAYDRPHSMSYLSGPMFAGWGVGFDEAYDAAVTNLRAACKLRPFRKIAPGLFLSDWCDGCDSSRLLLEETIRGLDIKGAPVAMAPTRDMLIVTGSEDLSGLRRMVEVTNQVKDRGYRASLTPITLASSGWRTFRIPDGHPLHRGFRELRIEDLVESYTAQRESLAPALANDGIYLAQYLAGTRKDGEPTSFCFWCAMADTLLPKTDYIAIPTGDEEGAALLVAWNKAAKILEISSSADARFHPARFMVKGRLTDERRRKLMAIRET